MYLISDNTPPRQQIFVHENLPEDIFRESLLVADGFCKRPLRLISYLIPGIPEAFYELVISELQKILKHPIQLIEAPGTHHTDF
jgi:hypothetical protein